MKLGEIFSGAKFRHNVAVTRKKRFPCGQVKMLVRTQLALNALHVRRVSDFIDLPTNSAQSSTEVVIDGAKRKG